MSIRQINYKKNILSIILTIGAILGMIMIPYSICEAASATITLSTDETTVIIGDEVLVDLTLSSATEMGDFEAYLSYDSDVLEFQSDATFIAGGEGLIKISDLNVANGDYSRKYVIKFKSIKVGNSEISINDKATIYDFESTQDMSISANKLTINIEATKTASKNANLKLLKISQGTLTPEFSSDVTDYSLKIDEKADKLVISAIAEDEYATVSIEGNDKLEPGDNKIIVAVKSESGHVKKYIIQAAYDDKQQEENTTETAETIENTKDPLNENNNKDLTEINNIQVMKDGDKVYIQNGFRYVICPISDEVEIPAGFIKTSIIINDITVDAFTPEDDLESDFLLLYVQNEAGELGLYQYDRIEKTLQRYTGSSLDNTNKLILSDEMMQSEEYKDKLTTMSIVIAVLGAILIMMSITLIHIFMKTKEIDS